MACDKALIMMPAQVLLTCISCRVKRLAFFLGSRRSNKVRAYSGTAICFIHDFGLVPVSRMKARENAGWLL